MAKYPAVRQLFLNALGNPLPERTGKDLADALGVEEASTSRWLNGEGRPRPHRWPALAGYLKVDVTEVRAACEESTRTADVTPLGTARAAQVRDEARRLFDVLSAGLAKLEGRVEALERGRRRKPS